MASMISSAFVCVFVILVLYYSCEYRMLVVSVVHVLLFLAFCVMSFLCSCVLVWCLSVYHWYEVGFVFVCVFGG